MKFRSENHSLIFHTSSCGTKDPVFFNGYEHETEDKGQIKVLQSERAVKSGISAVDSVEDAAAETPAAE